MLLLQLLFLRYIYSTCCSVQYENKTLNSVYDNKTFVDSDKFRVAHGEHIEIKDYEHLVRVMSVYQRTLPNPDGIRRPVDDEWLRAGKYTYTISTCTGMKVTPDQLQGQTTDRGAAHASTLYVLTAGHCIKQEKEKWINVVTNTGTERRLEHYQKLKHVFVVSGQTYVPKPWWFEYAKKFVFRTFLEHNVYKVNWASYYYPYDKGSDIDAIDNKEDEIDIHDIALLKVTTEMTTPVIMLEYDAVPQRNDECSFAGWGDDHRGKNDHKLKKVKAGGMKIVPHEHDDKGHCSGRVNSMFDKFAETFAEKCKRVNTKAWRDEYKKNETRRYTQAVICTVHPSGSVGCSGDSGGPLICKKSEAGEAKVYAVFRGGVGIREAWTIPLISSCVDLRTKKLDCGQQGIFFGSEQLGGYTRLSEDKTKNYLKHCGNMLTKSDEQIRDAQRNEAAEVVRKRARNELIDWSEYCALNDLSEGDIIFADNLVGCAPNRRSMSPTPELCTGTIYQLNVGVFCLATLLYLI